VISGSHVADRINNSLMRIRVCPIPSFMLGLAIFSLCVVGPYASAQAPLVSKVEPPNWWTDLPDPMLLVRGEHLQEARFSVHHTKALIKNVRISANGHWAFVQLSIAAASPGTFSMEAQNSRGTTAWSYTLASRRAVTAQPQGFSSRDVMYLIMTDRFADGDPSNNRQPGMPYDPSEPRSWHGGDLRGIQQHLDYLKDLGVSTVWITPVYQNREPDSYHGYGATDMYSVDEHFGTLDDLTLLSNDLHEHGMKLVLDIVPNHVGPAHPWVEDPPTPDWFHGTKANHRAARGTFQSFMDPDASERDRRDALEGWFVDLLPDMNQENPLVAQYLIQNTIWWVEETGADGLRLDTFPYVGRPFWHDFHAQLLQLYPRLTTVGEVFNGTFAMPVALNSFFAGGVVRGGHETAIDTGLYTPFDYPLYSMLRDVLLHDARMSDLANLFRQDGLYPHPERLATLLGSHDTKRFLGEGGANPEKLRLALGILLTLRGMPVIYSGDEIGMTGDDDPDNRRDFPGGFRELNPSDAANAFLPSGRNAEQARIHDWVKRVLAVRNGNMELQEGRQQLQDADQDVISYVRGFHLEHGCTASDNRILVIANKSQQLKTVSVITPQTALAGCAQSEILFGEEDSVEFTPQAIRAQVAPFGLTIIRLRWPNRN